MACLGSSHITPAYLKPCIQVDLPSHAESPWVLEGKPAACLSTPSGTRLTNQGWEARLPLLTLHGIILGIIRYLMSDIFTLTLMLLLSPCPDSLFQSLMTLLLAVFLICRSPQMPSQLHPQI